MRVVVPDDFNGVYDRSQHIQRLRERADVAVYTEPFLGFDDVVERLKDAEIVVANRERTPLKSPVLEHLPRLQFIAQTGQRGAHLDMEALTARGIPVAGTSGSGTSTVDLAVGLIIAAMRGIPYQDRMLHQGVWTWTVGRELAGKTLGILGLGRLGSGVARVCQALGMEVIAWGPTLTPERAAQHEVGYRALDDLLREADVISIHLQLSEISRGLLSREKLALLKPTALLVNTSRGPIVDEAALIEALREHRIFGAALDVYDVEPLPSDHPLTKLDNVVLTAHAGWVVEGSYDHFISAVVENIVSYLDGDPKNVVNPAALERRV